MVKSLQQISSTLLHKALRRQTDFPVKDLCQIFSPLQAFVFSKSPGFLLQYLQLNLKAENLHLPNRLSLIHKVQNLDSGICRWEPNLACLAGWRQLRGIYCSERFGEFSLVSCDLGHNVLECFCCLSSPQLFCFRAAFQNILFSTLDVNVQSSVYLSMPTNTLSFEICLILILPYLLPLGNISPSF